MKILLYALNILLWGVNAIVYGFWYGNIPMLILSLLGIGLAGYLWRFQR